MPATAAVLWEDVMQGLTGLRLAIHDELLNNGAIDAGQLATLPVQDGAIEAAVAWLVTHRLLVSEGGQWRAVLPGLARVQFEMSGPAEPNAQRRTPNAERSSSQPVEQGRTAAVQKHQVEFFTLEGYRDSNGSRD